MPDDKTAAANGARRGELISAAVFILAVMAAIFLRFYLIGIKPFHHDESVNSYFLLDLWRSAHYAYNPENYHGPTLYYFALVGVRLLGMNDLALRFSPAVWGVLTVLALWPLRRWLGQVGTPVAAWLIALSPGLVYFSRDFIHESSFGFFSLGIFVGAWRYAETKKFAWMLLLAICAGLLFATKETAIITVVVLLLAAVCAAVWDIGRRLVVRTSSLDLIAIMREIWRDTRAMLPSLDHCGAALIIFLFLNLVFYSSFFTHWKGVAEAVKSVLMWTGRGVSKQEHYHVFTYYLGILIKLELPLLISAMVGTVVTLWRGTRFGLFIFAWAAGITIGYSLIPYKTPWLMVSLLIPLALLGGYAAEVIFAQPTALSSRLLWLAIVAVMIVPCGVVAWQQNFQHYADNENTFGYFRKLGQQYQLTPWTDTQYGYVYAQTDVGTLALAQAIRDAAARKPEGKETGIYISSPDYWPLPWYLRDYPRAVFAGSMPLELTQPIVIAAPHQQAQIEAMLGGQVHSETFKLRPGVDLVLCVKQKAEGGRRKAEGRRQ